MYNFLISQSLMKEAKTDPKPQARQALDLPAIQNLIHSNRQILRRLPELLMRQLQCYEKAHLDESSQISKSIEDTIFLDQLSSFKSASFEFVDGLSKMKKNFTSILTREQQTNTCLDPKKVSNFDVFVAEHCQNVVAHHLKDISTISVEENVPEMEI